MAHRFRALPEEIFTSIVGGITALNPVYFGQQNWMKSSPLGQTDTDSPTSTVTGIKTDVPVLSVMSTYLPPPSSFLASLLCYGTNRTMSASRDQESSQRQTTHTLSHPYMVHECASLPLPIAVERLLLISTVTRLSHGLRFV
jgi:hypothetical protein